MGARAARRIGGFLSAYLRRILRSREPGGSVATKLTEEEKRVLKSLAAGRTSEEIAVELGISDAIVWAVVFGLLAEMEGKG